MEDLKKFDLYLGDGVYASFDGYQIWLAANDPGDKVIALDPKTFRSLIEYGKWLKTQLQA